MVDAPDIRLDQAPFTSSAPFAAGLPVSLYTKLVPGVLAVASWPLGDFREAAVPRTSRHQPVAIALDWRISIFWRGDAVRH